MANMSYCRFGNTSIDLRDCISAVNEAIESGLSFQEFYADLGEYEQTAFNHLVRYSHLFVEAVAELRDFIPEEGNIYDNEMDA